jgi:HSP20 family protein
MANITRRDPYMQDLFDFRRNFDDLFQQFFASPFGFSQDRNRMGPWAPPVETWMDEGKYHVRVAVPGIDPRDVNIEVRGNELAISGERRSENEVNEDKYLQREIRYGSFQRLIPLPEGIDQSKVEANCHNGVLEIAAPIAENAKPRRIEVKTGGQLTSGAQKRTAA